MMGTQNKQNPLFLYQVNLEARIHPEHPLRKIKAALDFSFVRAEVEDRYGYNGNGSVDPEVILKLMFLLFFEDVASERELMRVLPCRLDWLWVLDLGLEDPIPDHSVLSKARRRWGREVFESLFVRTIRSCLEAGLVEGSKLHADGSLVDANASNDSVKPGPPELIARLKAAYLREERKLAELEESPPKPEGGDGEKPGGSSGYQAVNDRRVSQTDPEAAVVRKGKLSARPRYKHHRSVDDRFGVITAVETTPGDVEENAKLFPLVEQSERNTEKKVETVVGDRQYGTAENYRECGERGITSHLADLSESHRDTGRKRGIFPERAFVYDAERDSYRCPGGQILSRRRHRKKRRAYEYAISPKVCAECGKREQCTRSKTGRSIKRHEGQELIEAARGQAHSWAAKQDRRRRKYLMEGSFADAANGHGFKRSRWRGLWRQKIQDWLIAACQNLRLLLALGWKRPVAGMQAAAAEVKSGLFLSLARAILAFRNSFRRWRTLRIEKSEFSAWGAWDR
jgi:transposase